MAFGKMGPSLVSEKWLLLFFFSFRVCVQCTSRFNRDVFLPRPQKQNLTNRSFFFFFCSLYSTIMYTSKKTDNYMQMYSIYIYGDVVRRVSQKKKILT